MDTRKPVGTKQTWYVEPPKGTTKFGDWVGAESKQKKAKPRKRETQLDDEEDDTSKGKTAKDPHEDKPKVMLTLPPLKSPHLPLKSQRKTLSVNSYLGVGKEKTWGEQETADGAV